MLFAICADRGAPGSTTTALALAAARGLPAVFVEADPYGGDLALRIRLDGKQPLPTTPTVLGVSAGRSAQQTSGPIVMPEHVGAGRRHRDLWRDGAHQLTDLVRVVPGFMAAEHGTSMAWPVLASALESQSVPIFADLGRIHTGSPSLPIAAAADALITVCRGDMASVQHMVDRLELLVPAIAERNGRPPVVLPVVVAPHKHGTGIAGSVAEILGETSVGPTLRGVSWLAWDPASVHLLENGADPWAKPLRRSPLMRSARKVMWMLGLATGLTHAEPVTGKGPGSKLGVRRRDQQTPSDEGGHSWSEPVPQNQPPAPQPGQAPQDPAGRHRPTPPPTWTPRNELHPGMPRDTRHEFDSQVQQEHHGDRADGARSGTEQGASRWETAARQERH